jgi:hypothetical protein
VLVVDDLRTGPLRVAVTSQKLSSTYSDCCQVRKRVRLLCATSVEQAQEIVFIIKLKLFLFVQQEVDG